MEDQYLAMQELVLVELQVLQTSCQLLWQVLELELLEHLRSLPMAPPTTPAISTRGRNGGGDGGRNGDGGGGRNGGGSGDSGEDSGKDEG